MSLQEVVALAEACVAADFAVKELEIKLKNAKERARRLAEEDLPMAMEEQGLIAVQLSNGGSVKIERRCEAGISSANSAEAFEWLRSKGFGGLIKTAIKIDFGMDEDEEAQKFYEKYAAKYGGELKEFVHPQTLKAWVREQLANGASIPVDLFGVREYRVAKIIHPTGA